MERFDINVNLKQAEAIEWLMKFILEDEGLTPFLEMQEMDRKDFNELYAAVNKAALSLGFSKALLNGNYIHS